MASNGQDGEGGSGISSSKRGRRSGKKAKEPKERQRGMGIAELEFLSLQTPMNAAAAANVAGGSFVPNNLHDFPVYPITSPNQMHEGMRVQNPYYLSPLPPSFSYAPMNTTPFLAGPQGVKGDLNNFQMPGDSSSPFFWHTSDHPAPSLTPYGLNCPQSTKMSMGSEVCDLLLGPSTRRNEEEDDDDLDLEFRPPNYFTNLLLAEDTDEEETEQKGKKARTDSSSVGSSAAAGSSNNQEPDLEL